MYNIKISIIIPVYNSEKYIDECIQSLLNQTFTDFEIICVNDGSTDSSEKILENYQQKADNINVFNKKNEGPGSARNYGLENAHGKYVFFLDSDDWIEYDTLETLYNTAEENNSELVLFNSIEHYPNNIKRERIYHVIKDDNNYQNFSFDYNNNINLVMNGYHIVCTKLHNLEFIRKHSLKFANQDQFEDVLFHIKSMIFAKRISYNPKILYHYRRNKQESRQNTAIKGEKSLQFFKIFDELKDFLLKEKLYEKFKINYYRFVINETRHIEENIDEKYEEILFDKIKITFKKLKINDDDFKKLPLDYQYFFKDIITSQNIKDFKRNQKRTQIKRKFSEKRTILKHHIKKLLK